MSIRNGILRLVLAEDGKNPLVLESDWIGLPNRPLPLLREPDAPVKLRAICILLLLAKYQGYPAMNSGSNPTFTFQCELDKCNWISSLADTYHKEKTANAWITNHFGIKYDDFFFSGGRGSMQNKVKLKSHPCVEYRSQLLPLINLQLSVRSRNSTSSDSTELVGDDLLYFAFALEARHWDTEAIEDLLRLGLLRPPSRKRTVSKGNNVGPSLDAVTKKALLKEALYLARRNDTQMNCVQFLEMNSESWPDLINEPLNSYGDSLLLIAISFRRPVIVDYLLSKDACDVNIHNTARITPLLKALSLNDVDLTARLIAKGADVRVKSGMDTSVVHEAVFGAVHSLKLIEMLIPLLEKQNCEWNSFSRDGLLPLTTAIARKCPDDTLGLLLERTAATAIERRNILGETPVYMACKNGDYDTVVKLISKLIEAKVTSWQFPLRISQAKNEVLLSVQKGDIEHVKHALKSSHLFDDPKKFWINQTDEIFGRSCLHVAVIYAHWDIVELLMESNANPFVQDYHGRIPREYLPFEKTSIEAQVHFELTLYEQRHNEYFHKDI
jgi:ankyrin repeat protein